MLTKLAYTYSVFHNAYREPIFIAYAIFSLIFVKRLSVFILQLIHLNLL